mmetsp:Transcript_11221/g.26233  ORF Transcript_11221/g.26233 Transcript_11221/m.26233 type:complete len:207 (-) Transcript_11221:1094-1714(-)
MTMSSTPPSLPGPPGTLGTGNVANRPLLGASLTGAGDGRGMTTGLTSAASAPPSGRVPPAVPFGVPGQTGDEPPSSPPGVSAEASSEPWGLSGLSGLVSGVSAWWSLLSDLDAGGVRTSFVGLDARRLRTSSSRGGLEHVSRKLRWSPSDLFLIILVMASDRPSPPAPGERLSLSSVNSGMGGLFWGRWLKRWSKYSVDVMVSSSL